MNQIGTKILLLLVCFAATATIVNRSMAKPVVAQAEAAVEDSIDQNEKAAPPTILKMLFGGNLLGMAIVLLILLLSVVSLFVISDNAWRITATKLMPDKVLSELEARIVHGDVTQAMEMCRQKANYSMSTEIISLSQL